MTKREDGIPKNVKEGVLGGTERRWSILDVGDLPIVPPDQEQVLKDGALATRRFPDASFAEGINGLKEVADRGQIDPGELGDLVSPVSKARNAALVLERTRAVMVRLEALMAYHRAVMAIEENNANAMIDMYAEEAERRIAKARIPPEAYGNLRKYVSARGELIARGIAQAKAVRKAEATKPAPTPEKEGTRP